jgi:2-polyprenyl-3-methyl-5-hydroxy-6-metoxy-1,4-benzoquinol methylase
MNLVNKLLFKIRNRVNSVLFKNRQFKTEEEFYTHLFTRNPAWNSPEANEDETIRWTEIKKNLEMITADKHAILEIGCGRGWLTNNLNNYGRAIGIDPVAPVIKYARKLFPKLEFHAETPTSYLARFPNQKFDLVVSSEVLEHVVDKGQFMKEANLLLKKNGHFILTTPRAEHYKDSIEAYGGDPNQPVEDWVSEEQLKKLLEENGFTVLNKNFFAPLPNLKKTVLVTQIWLAKKSIPA